MVVASVIGELVARAWTRQARCIDGPDLNWTCSVQRRGIEPPGTVVACIEICATCPVRRACLDDAIGEQRFTVTGVWGGTVTTERLRAVGLARRQDREAPESEIRARAAAELEATFQSRLAIWEHLAGRGRHQEPTATKHTVAVGVAWT